MLTLERKIVASFAAAVVILLLVTLASWWNAARFRRTSEWVDHTREVLSELERAATNIFAMQANARGFVLTGSDDVLRPFEVRHRQLGASFANLRQKLADNPAQLGRLAQLEPLGQRAIDRMLERIAARRQRGLDAAAETHAYLDGQASVEAFQRIVDQMVMEERALLQRRVSRADRQGRLTVFTLLGTSALTLAVGLIGARIVRRDMVRRQESAAALEASRARYQDLYDHAPCGYHSLDETGRIIEMNHTALTWLGYTREEVVGRKNFREILAPGSVDAFEQRFPKFVRGAAVESVEYDWRRKDGTTFPVLLNATAICDAAGKYVASRATVFDITQRKRAEAERDRVFTLSRDLLCIAGYDGYFKRLNPSWEQTLGYPDSELAAKPLVEFVHPEDRERTLTETSRVMAGQESIAFENRFICRDGSVRWLRWSARAVTTEKLIYASAHDVTEQRAAATRILRLNADLATRARELEQANQELESFSYSVSHDLRAPLRHIDGFSALLAKRASETLDAESRRFLATISRSAKHMGALIDDLLAFSRISRVPLRLEAVDVGRLVAETISHGNYDATGTAIAWHIGPLPSVHADAGLLRQIWANLLDNAVKYTSKSAAPRIEIGAADSPENGECVFHIRDNGVGFDMKYADKLFGVFQRLHSSAEFEGTGIGLANVRRIVMRHGGRTWAEGRVDEGAVFYFSLPRHRVASRVSA